MLFYACEDSLWTTKEMLIRLLEIDCSGAAAGLIGFYRYWCQKREVDFKDTGVVSQCITGDAIHRKCKVPPATRKSITKFMCVFQSW